MENERHFFILKPDFWKRYSKTFPAVVANCLHRPREGVISKRTLLCYTTVPKTFSVTISRKFLFNFDSPCFRTFALVHFVGRLCVVLINLKRNLYEHLYIIYIYWRLNWSIVSTNNVHRAQVYIIFLRINYLRPNLPSPFSFIVLLCMYYSTHNDLCLQMFQPYVPIFIFI